MTIASTSRNRTIFDAPLPFNSSPLDVHQETAEPAFAMPIILTPSAIVSHSIAQVVQRPHEVRSCRDDLLTTSLSGAPHGSLSVFSQWPPEQRLPLRARSIHHRVSPFCRPPPQAISICRRKKCKQQKTQMAINLSGFVYVYLIDTG